MLRVVIRPPKPRAPFPRRPGRRGCSDACVHNASATVCTVRCVARRGAPVWSLTGDLCVVLSLFFFYTRRQTARVRIDDKQVHGQAPVAQHGHHLRAGRLRGRPLLLPTPHRRVKRGTLTKMARAVHARSIANPAPAPATHNRPRSRPCGRSCTTDKSRTVGPSPAIHVLVLQRCCALPRPPSMHLACRDAAPSLARHPRVCTWLAEMLRPPSLYAVGVDAVGAAARRCHPRAVQLYFFIHTLSSTADSDPRAGARTCATGHGDAASAPASAAVACSACALNQRRGGPTGRCARAPPPPWLRRAVCPKLLTRSPRCRVAMPVSPCTLAGARRYIANLAGDDPVSCSVPAE